MRLLSITTYLLNHATLLLMITLASLLNHGYNAQGFAFFARTNVRVSLPIQLHQQRRTSLSMDKAVGLDIENKRTSSVAIVGSGAVGGYYGSRLWEAGHNVSFYMRGEHYLQSKANGLNVTVS
jgi:hypothetical protein